MVNDETLCAYIDGELDHAERMAVERQAAADPGVALRLRRLRDVDAVLREAFGEPPAEAEPRADAPGRDWRAIARHWAPLAAASLIGVVVGISAPLPGERQPEPTAMPALLERALTETRSGATATADHQSVRLAQTLVTEGGDLCRQYRWQSAAGAVDGVACREDESWRLRAHVAVAEAPNSVTYQAAGASSADPIMAAVEALGPAFVLDESEEAALIANGWRGRR